jgi:hypothetical protein
VKLGAVNESTRPALSETSLVHVRLKTEERTEENKKSSGASRKSAKKEGSTGGRTGDLGYLPRAGIDAENHEQREPKPDQEMEKLRMHQNSVIPRF